MLKLTQNAACATIFRLLILVQVYSMTGSSAIKSRSPSSSSSSHSLVKRASGNSLDNTERRNEKGTAKSLTKRSEEYIFGDRESSDGAIREKKWKQMSAWGKRDLEEDIDKRWKQMSAWGKRDLPEELEKRWKQMSAWGKRDEPDAMDKRWKQMSAWGKRDEGTEPEKRWKQMSAWGKRYDPEEVEKKWKQMSAWGKRDEPEDLEKRWKQMSVWGKRDHADSDIKRFLASTFTHQKRSNERPSNDNEISVSKRWRRVKTTPESSGKRRGWSKLTIWGKRSANNW